MVTTNTATAGGTLRPTSPTPTIAVGVAGGSSSSSIRSSSSSSRPTAATTAIDQITASIVSVCNTMLEVAAVASSSSSSEDPEQLPEDPQTRDARTIQILLAVATALQEQAATKAAAAAATATPTSVKSTATFKARDGGADPGNAATTATNTNTNTSNSTQPNTKKRPREEEAEEDSGSETVGGAAVPGGKVARTQAATGNKVTATATLASTSTNTNTNTSTSPTNSYQTAEQQEPEDDDDDDNNYACFATPRTTKEGTEHEVEAAVGEEAEKDAETSSPLKRSNMFGHHHENMTTTEKAEGTGNEFTTETKKRSKRSSPETPGLVGVHSPLLPASTKRVAEGEATDPEDNNDEEDEDDATVAMTMDNDDEAEAGEAGDTVDAEVTTTIAASEEEDTEDHDDGTNPHAKYDAVLHKSCQTLRGLEQMLTEDLTPSREDDAEEYAGTFCSKARNDEWTTEIRAQLAQGVVGPTTIVGVLGATGVGKSSLLNALLDEAAVLPTSGSRGCTAAVVELTYNRALCGRPTTTPPLTTTGGEGGTTQEPKVPIYKGKVEFMKLSDWLEELKLLVDECSTQNQTIYARPPEEQNQPDAAAGWAKIDQVYGRGTMYSFRGEATQYVYQRLSTTPSVVKLLTPKPTSTDDYNAVYVQEGLIDVSDASTVLCDYDQMGLRVRRNLKRYAKAFRAKINDYVYRKGNGNEAQTWPLIRSVQLQGPWSVLSSGAVLVDLPGIRDANAARARVAERYLQHCNQIWVVAPIKRAVDDGTAKELMGAEFKRRLLMDGQYGNVAFICTQTDDCEATEIMRDHEDIAVKEEGRWEKMVDLQSRCNEIETELSNLKEEEDELKFASDEAEEGLKELTQELEDAIAPPKRKSKRLTAGTCNADDDGDENFIIDDDDIEDMDEDGDDEEVVKVIDEETLQEMKDAIEDQSKKFDTTKVALLSWTNLHSEKINGLTMKCHRLQRKLKGVCAKVRNEYSTRCLKEDFISGLKEMYRDSRGNDDDNDGEEERNDEITIPDNMSLPVFCISANDYLKVTGIKPSSDGPPNCFTSATDTQMKSLREFVHTTTASRRVLFAETFVRKASDLIDRVKLLANDSTSDGGSTRSKVRCQNLFQDKMNELGTKIGPIEKKFLDKCNQKIMTNLTPSLKKGAKKAHSSAMTTVHSWGSKSRRSRHERNAEHNGLYYSTYFATVRRDGVYVSASAGSIDMNAELASPMEAEYTPAWSSIMDNAVRNLISESERDTNALCKQLDLDLLQGFYSVGIDKARVASMVNISAANRGNVIRDSFASMRELAQENQRELSRSLLPKVQQSLKQSYNNTLSVTGGCGKFNRMKHAMHTTSSIAVDGLFDECMKDLLDAIEGMVQVLSGRIDALKESISNSLSSVYSILWEDQNGGKIVDPIRQQKVLACRAACLPILNELRKKQDRVMAVLGIERPVLDLEIAQVETWEQTNAKKMQEAIDQGDFVDVDDDSQKNNNGRSARDVKLENNGAFAEDDEASSNWNPITGERYGGSDQTNATRNSLRIKAEMGQHRNIHSNSNSSSNGDKTKTNAIIDLLSDSDDDDDDVGEMLVVYARSGSLGLVVDREDTILDGFVVKTVRVDSQLKGRVCIGDIITSFDSRRLEEKNQEELAHMIQESSNRPSRRICIRRSTKQHGGAKTLIEKRQQQNRARAHAGLPSLPF